ncbi:Rhodanese domain protein (plasmid) [Legionella adelaidensis]|uniref:Rhodanese domain protein n=1 Tax=Legionella adelaidensis TaxID=45056 RepID=A0A0W0R395_9GAMM|nr:rhodanese-like domain-containing protein [Legionella adelaidensis]KTC65553.1 Rhodanese domain protein [Legionella adelaidensis]VEH84626.1 Rhodanese domain protein [Legionella adelaidensis]
MINPEVHTISVQELKKRQETNPELCLIDVRENEEWEESRIPGALHIPKDEITQQIEKHIPDRHQPIYLHCRAGARSLYAARCLIDMGYQEVYSVNGGISEWEMNGYPIER